MDGYKSLGQGRWFNQMKKKDQENYNKRLREHRNQIWAWLVGKTIKDAEYDPSEEGTYKLTFTDGSFVTFSSSGDDATSTIIDYVKPPTDRSESDGE